MSYIINKSELNAAAKFTTSGDLRTDANNSLNMVHSINDFRGRPELQGEGWHSIFASLGEYGNVLEKRFDLASSLSVIISTVLNDLINYMGDYDTIDTSQKEELENAINACNQRIELLTSLCNAQDPVYEAITDEAGNITGYKDTGRKTYHYSESQRESFTKTIDTIKTQIDTVLQPYLDKIIGLDAVYQRAEEMLSEAFAGIDEFEESVNSLTPHQVMV